MVKETNPFIQYKKAYDRNGTHSFMCATKDWQERDRTRTMMGFWECSSELQISPGGEQCCWLLGEENWLG